MMRNFGLESGWCCFMRLDGGRFCPWDLKGGGFSSSSSGGHGGHGWCLGCRFMDSHSDLVGLFKSSVLAMSRTDKISVL